MMNAGKSFIAGAAGGAAMSVLFALARMVGVPVHLEMMLGTMVADPGTTAWIIGFVMHLMISGLIALIYAWGFEHVTHKAGWAVGVGFSLIHSVIAGTFMGMIPLMHPRMPNPVMPPGFFMANLGIIGPVIVFMFHAVYGAIVGAMYGPTRERAGNNPQSAR